MKRRRGAATDDDSSSSSGGAPSVAPPRVINSTVNFALGPVNPHLTCRLCDGYFRDPITITECLHTFCKSCLYYAFSSGFCKCPTCDVQLGPDPTKSTLHDRTKEELVDRVLFPDVKENDEALERDFYAQKGISLKPSYRHEHDKKRTYSDQPLEPETVNAQDELDVLLLPATRQTPRIPYDLLTTSGRMKVLQLKRFLLARLESTKDPNTIELTVKGSVVGNELSLTFLQRTMWLDHTQPIEIRYRCDDGV
jgi:polycomb group RING finger protein 3